MEKKFELSWEIDVMWQQLYDQNFQDWDLCLVGEPSDGREGGLWWNLIIQMDILGWDGTAITDEEWFVPSSPQLTWWPASVLQCWSRSATMHAINVSVICIFSATSTPGIFLKSMMLLSPEHALIPILKEQLLTAQSIKFLSFNKTENKKCEHH